MDYKEEYILSRIKALETTVGFLNSIIHQLISFIAFGGQITSDTTNPPANPQMIAFGGNPDTGLLAVWSVSQQIWIPFISQ